MKYYTYEQLKDIAIKSGINNNKTAIGLHLKKLGYLKKYIRNGLILEFRYYKPE